jgi:hypothetical protein
MHSKSNQAGRTVRRRAILAGLSAGLSLLGAVAVVWGESRAYASLTDARLESRVGSKGSCCTPGLKTACSSSGSYVCTSSGVVCDPTATSNDTCGDPNCGDSDTKTDQCDTMNFGTYAVTVSICATTSSAPIPCDGGLRCEFMISSGTMEYLGCGTTTICAVTSGAACQ